MLASDTATLVGREAEQARVARVLDAARAGHSAALVLHGDAGAGKTALLAHALAGATGLQVLRARAVESEAELPFSALHELLRPLVGRVDGLPGPQASALRAALALGPADAAADRFTVGAAVLSLLAAAAEDEPVAAVVDDVHWLDRASADALAFAARRLEADRVAMLFALRGEVPALLTEAGFDELRVGPLDAASAADLLASRFGPALAPAVAAGVRGAAAGNPLALLEIAAGLSEGQRAGRVPVDDPLGGGALERTVRRRVEALPADVRVPLLVAATSETGDMHTVLAAAARLGADGARLEAAEAEGLLAIADGRATFRHPLLRSAVVRAATPPARRAAHGALAESLEGDAVADQRAWHAASAALAADESIAAALERTATQARRRGGYAAAERAYVRAAALSVDDEDRARRLHEGAEAALLAGRAEPALALLAQAVRLTADGARRSSIEHLRGRIASRIGSAREAHGTLVAEAARLEASDPALASLLLSEAVLPAMRDGRPRLAVETARRAAALAPPDALRAQALAALMLGMGLVFTGVVAEGRELVRRAASLAQADGTLAGEPQLRGYLGAGLRFAGDHDAARAVLRSVVDEARDASAPGVLPYALARLGGLELETGRWTAAAAALHEALQLARETGQAADRGLTLGVLAWLDAAQGRDAECRDRAAEALGLARELGGGSRLDYASAALGLLALGRGRPEEAIGPLADAARVDAEQGWSDAAVPPHHGPDLVEAYARAGRPADAARVLESFAADAVRTGRPAALAAAARCRGLVAGDDFDEPFAEALEHHAGDADPFGAARTRLLYGERLRRAGRRVDSRDQLRPALAAFEALGASPWTDRAAEELRATGESVRRRDPAAVEQLTPHELQVALVVAEGVTNREAAARLFLSPKTVEFHLGRIFRKLGVRTRTELAQAMAREPGGGTAGAAG